MKKSFFCGVVLFFALIVFAGREAGAYKCDPLFGPFGEIGVGAIDSNFDFNLKFLNFFFDLLIVGTEIIPVEYNYSKFYDGHRVSFLNTKLYVNLLFNNEYNFMFGDVCDKNRLILGPFIAVSPLNIPNYHLDNYIVDVGLKFAYAEPLATSLLNIEIGSKYLKHDHKRSFFINVSSGIPLVLPCLAFISPKLPI